MQDPSRERIVIMDEGNAAMQLLLVAWQQMPLEVVQLHRKGATTYQAQVMSPLQRKHVVNTPSMSSSRILSICSKFVKRRVGIASNTGVGPTPGARCDCSNGRRPLPKGPVYKETVCMNVI